MSDQPTSTNPSSTPQPTIFLLSLAKESYFDDMYSRLIDALASKAALKRASKPSGALNYLSANTPTAILITDAELKRPAHSAVLEKVISYVRGGGTAIFAAQFSSFINTPDLNRFFGSKWGVGWTFGDYLRTNVHLNPQAQRIPQSSLPDAYSLKAVFLKNVSQEAAWYLPSEDSRTQSHVFPSERVDVGQTPVAFAKVGEGWLGYVGDVNTEEESDAVILGMCGLL